MQQHNNGLVVICCASAGVGRATAHRFAAAGYRIGLLARDAAGLAATHDGPQPPRAIAKPATPARTDHRCACDSEDLLQP